MPAFTLLQIHGVPSQLPCDNPPPLMPAQMNTPTSAPRTQTKVAPSTSNFCPLVIPPDVIDSDDESIPEGDLVLYHRVVVHNY